MAEVYLDGVFGREYRKSESAIPVGFGPGRHREEAGEGCQSGGRGGESGVTQRLLRRNDYLGDTWFGY